MTTIRSTLWKDPFLEESVERFGLNPGDMCKYGIKCLDDAIGGIFKNDLVVIGADSGAGKSELALNIAQHNAQNGKKVVLYYLEGGHIEAIRRMKWRDVVDLYYKEHRYANLDIDYKGWVSNSIVDPNGVLKKIEQDVLDRYDRLYKDNLYLCQIDREFSLTDFISSIAEFYGEEKRGNWWHPTLDADLILIDHLQYFSLANGEAEISGITNILRECKHITDRYKIPIVLVSHLRKKGKDRGIPDQEDFYGSSNIPKISTTAITMSPDYVGEDMSKDRYPTFFRIAKSRTGVRSNIAIRSIFDLKFRKYDDDYKIFRIDNFGKPSEKPLEDLDKPTWSR